MNILKNIPNESLLDLTVRAFQNLDNAMTRMGESGDNPYGFGGALSFGWDFPTASVYFPHLTGRFYALKREVMSRGIKSVKYNCHRVTRGKDKGKIIYERVKEKAA
jgi:hypothetical protein